MKLIAHLLAVSFALVASSQAADLSKEAQKAVKDLAPPAQQLQPPAQGKQPGNQQQSPNQIPPNQIPQGQQLPPGPQIPDDAALQDPARRSVDRSRAPGQDRGVSHDAIGADQLDALRPERESLGLDQLNADDARKQPGFDASRFGRRPGAGDAETDALVDRLRGITGGGNRDRMSDQTRSYGAGIATDPQSMLDGAASGLASDNVKIEITHNADGSTTRTTTRRDENGQVIQRDYITQDSNGMVVRAEDSSVLGNGDTATHRAERTPQGDYVHTVTIHRRDGTTNIGPTPWRSPEWVANVDPDSAYGKGNGSPVDTDKRPDNVVHGSDAKNGVGPGARPDENAGGGATPRLNANVDLVGQPNPTEGAGGAGPGYQGYNPNDFVRPPRPNDP